MGRERKREGGLVKTCKWTTSSSPRHIFSGGRELTQLCGLRGSVADGLEAHVWLARLQPHKEATLWGTSEVAHPLQLAIGNALIFILCGRVKSLSQTGKHPGQNLP